MAGKLRFHRLRHGCWNRRTKCGWSVWKVSAFEKLFLFMKDALHLVLTVAGRVAGARKLEFMAESIAMPSLLNGKMIYDEASETVASLDRHIIEELDRLHGVVHELEKAYLHDERFEMNLAELRGLTEGIADLIEQRNVALAG